MDIVVGKADGNTCCATLSAGVTIGTVGGERHPEEVIGVGVDRGKTAMTGVTGAAFAMPRGRPDQGAVCAVTLSA